VCNRDGDTGETLDLRELRCRCNLEYRFAYANYSPPEEVVGTWASVDLAAAIRKLASVALKARRQNELSLIRTRMIRFGKSDAAIYQPHGEVVSRPREHYAFIADYIHR
jgi:hypothetical protein